MSSPILDELEARHLLQDVSDRQAIGEELSREVVTLYAGYDPTAPSLHIGNLIPTLLLARLQRAGHRPIVLVGGATGMIGDPSGKSDERQLLDENTIANNLARQRKQLEALLDFTDKTTGAQVVNNRDWFGPIRFVEFLRDVGKHLTVNYMTAKDSVRARLEDREQGISYTEFSYMLLQAYDFVQLAKERGCRLQVGGSDQWGNITAGIELARKIGGLPRLFGLTAPLLLDANGDKMGKTSSGTRVWLDDEMTSPYAFYQYWLNASDDDVERLLKIFSWRSINEIEEISASHANEPHKRAGQKALAEEVTRWIHGEDGLRGAIAASQVMFGGSLENLRDADLEPLLTDLPSSSIDRSELESGVELLELLARTGLAKSKGAARRLVQGGGVYINNIRVADVEKSVTRSDLGTESMLILRSGKKSYHLVKMQ